MNSIKVVKKLDFALFVLPLLVIYSVFFTYPLVGGIYYSFTDWNGVNQQLHFIGIKNFINCFNDGLFIYSIKFTLTYTVFYSVIINALGMLFALLLNQKFFRGRNFIRAVIFSPYVLNAVTVGFVWAFIFGKFMISLSEATNYFPLFGINWLTDKNIVIYSVTLVRIWVSLGYFMIIYLAGLQSIPEELVEASRIDGASGWERFKNITFPLIMPSITVAVFMALVSSLKIFEILITLTQGGPGTATESISYNIYREAFQKYNWGFASAKSVIFMGIILIITYLQLRLTKNREVEM